MLFSCPVRQLKPDIHVRTLGWKEEASRFEVSNSWPTVAMGVSHGTGPLNHVFSWRHPMISKCTLVTSIVLGLASAGLVEAAGRGKCGMMGGGKGCCMMGGGGGQQQHTMQMPLQPQQDYTMQAALQQQQQYALLAALQQQQQQNAMLAAALREQRRLQRQQQQKDAAPNALKQLANDEEVVQKREDPEEIAATRLKIARWLAADAVAAEKKGDRQLAIKLRDQAEERLQVVVSKYQGTKAADDAKELLDKLGR